MAYGRPYVDYYPMPSIPPRGSASSIREPHGSEPAFPWWIRTAVAEKAIKNRAAVAKGEMSKKPPGGGEDSEEPVSKAEKVKETCREAPAIEVEVTEIAQEEVAEVVAMGERYTGPVSVIQAMEETPGAETSVVRGDPEVPIPRDENTAENAARAVFKEPESRVFKGPVCDPPHNP